MSRRQERADKIADKRQTELATAITHGASKEVVRHLTHRYADALRNQDATKAMVEKFKR